MIIILKWTLKQQGQQVHATAAVTLQVVSKTGAHILRTLTTISFPKKKKKPKLHGINRTVTLVSHYSISLIKITDHVAKQNAFQNHYSVYRHVLRFPKQKALASITKIGNMDRMASQVIEVAMPPRNAPLLLIVQNDIKHMHS